MLGWVHPKFFRKVSRQFPRKNFPRWFFTILDELYVQSIMTLSPEAIPNAAVPPGYKKFNYSLTQF
jgi:hypothetical protein